MLAYARGGLLLPRKGGGVRQMKLLEDSFPFPGEKGGGEGGCLRVLINLQGEEEDKKKGFPPKKKEEEGKICWGAMLLYHSGGEKRRKVNGAHLPLTKWREGGEKDRQ